MKKKGGVGTSRKQPNISDGPFEEGPEKEKESKRDCKSQERNKSTELMMAYSKTLEIVIIFQKARKEPLKRHEFLDRTDNS